MKDFIEKKDIQVYLDHEIARLVELQNRAVEWEDQRKAAWQITALQDARLKLLGSRLNTIWDTQNKKVIVL